MISFPQRPILKQTLLFFEKNIGQIKWYLGWDSRSGPPILSFLVHRKNSSFKWLELLLRKVYYWMAFRMFGRPYFSQDSTQNPEPYCIISYWKHSKSYEVLRQSFFNMNIHYLQKLKKTYHHYLHWYMTFWFKI